MQYGHLTLQTNQDEYKKLYENKVFIRSNTDQTKYRAVIASTDEEPPYYLLFGESDTLSGSLIALAKAIRKSAGQSTIKPFVTRGIGK
jgi:hypothetical protein